VTIDESLYQFGFLLHQVVEARLEGFDSASTPFEPLLA